MESEILAKTLENMKVMAEVELALAEFYVFCSGIREPEKDFWLDFEKEEQKHAKIIDEMAQMIVEKRSLVVPNTSFNIVPVHNLKTFIARSMRRLQSHQLTTDFKTLLSIAWNIEFSILEIKYNDLFSIAEQEYEQRMQTILTESAAHRGKLGSKITAMRNSSARGSNRPVAKSLREPPKRNGRRGPVLKD